ncbi:MAG TPA: nucleotide exchange factor GrpE [Chthoniobacterales bacterium]|nr:nucleotide exchange factor GrpE [Chthoniobacterales bacterium]
MPDDFASTMQELSTAATLAQEQKSKNDFASLLREFRLVNESVQSLESALTRRVENIASIILPAHATEASHQFQKIEESLDSIRASESVNHRLFDSLHEELLKYRDNFLYESLQKPFVRDLIGVFDDLTTLATQLKTASEERKSERLKRWRENLANAIHALVEVFHRLEVTEVESKEFVDLAIHRVVTYEATKRKEDDGRIVNRIKRGFIWRGNVLRPEEVIALRCQ